MSTCDQIGPLLSAWLDRDLPNETCGVIDAHLRSCARCSEEMEALRSTVDLCRSYRSESVPGPLPGDKHEQLKEAFRKALQSLPGKDASNA